MEVKEDESLDKVVRENPCEERTLGQTLEGNKGAGHVSSLRENKFQAFET